MLGLLSLREVNITYILPNFTSVKIKITGMKVSLIGSNLWIIQKNSRYPESGLGSNAGSLASIVYQQPTLVVT
jgi:hypothetical protein